MLWFIMKYSIMLLLEYYTKYNKESSYRSSSSLCSVFLRQLQRFTIFLLFFLRRVAKLHDMFVVAGIFMFLFFVPENNFKHACIYLFW